MVKNRRSTEIWGFVFVHLSSFNLQLQSVIFISLTYLFPRSIEVFSSSATGTNFLTHWVIFTIFKIFGNFLKIAFSLPKWGLILNVFQNYFSCSLFFYPKYRFGADSANSKELGVPGVKTVLKRYWLFITKSTVFGIYAQSVHRCTTLGNVSVTTIEFQVSRFI